MQLAVQLFLIICGVFFTFYFFYFILMLIKSRPKSVKKFDSTMIPELSLVIPAHNEAKNIHEKLFNTVNLSYPKEKLEIIVVNDGSTDSTCQVVERFINDFPSNRIRLVSLPAWSGKASALNIAWQNCSGEIVVMTDADVILEKNALINIINDFADPTVGAVTGRLSVVFSKNSTAISERDYRSIFDLIRLGESHIDSTPIFNGLIMAFRRTVLGKLDHSIIADDTELSLVTREKGWKTKYNPNVIAYEFVTENHGIQLKQKIRRGRGIVQSFFRHKQMLFNRHYSKFGLIIFPSEFFMHIISPILFLIIVGLFPFFVYYTLPFISSPSNALFLGLFFFSSIFLMLLVRRSLLPEKQGTLNPFAIVATFVKHQVYLVLVIFSYLSRFLLRKGKTEDIKNAWLTKTS